MKSLTKKSQDKEPTDSREFILDMYQLIKVNNELINRLAIEIHYLNNEVLEQGRILRSLLATNCLPAKQLHEI